MSIKLEPADGLSPRMAKLLSDLYSSGSSETMTIVDALNEYAENGPEEASEESLRDYAEELRSAASRVINTVDLWEDQDAGLWYVVVEETFDEDGYRVAESFESKHQADAYEQGLEYAGASELACRGVFQADSEEEAIAKAKAAAGES